MITVIEPRNYMDNDSEESIGFRNHSLRTKNEVCDSMLRVCNICTIGMLQFVGNQIAAPFGAAIFCVLRSDWLNIYFC